MLYTHIQTDTAEECMHVCMCTFTKESVASTILNDCPTNRNKKTWVEPPVGACYVTTNPT